MKARASRGQGDPDRRAPVVHPDMDGVGPDGDSDHRWVGTDDESQIAVEHALLLVARPATDPEGPEVLGDGSTVGPRSSIRLSTDDRSC